MELGVWDSVTGRMIHMLQGHSDWISTATISGDGRTIVTGSDDTTLRGWDRSTGFYFCDLFFFFFFFPSLSRLSSISVSLFFWCVCVCIYGGMKCALHSGECTFVLKGHTGNVLCSTIDHDGSVVASGSLDGTVRVWDTRDKSCQHVLEGHSDWVRCCAISKEHGIVVSGSRDCALKLWCLKTGELIRTFQVR